MAWSEILGQPLALRILQAHLLRDRVASAYLFVGPPGVGKRMAARELAKALNCEQRDGAPCDQCAQCRRIIRGTHPDLWQLEPQGGSGTIHIEDIRQLLARVMLRPFMARTQVVIIDGAHRLTEEAANSLLKVLEEPPTHARLILLTDQLSDVLPTIRSRCQSVRFQRLPDSLVKRWLIEHERTDADRAATIASLAQGSLARAVECAKNWDAQSQCVARFTSGQPTAWLEWAVPKERQELARWIEASVWWLRDVAVGQAAGDEPLIHRAAAEAIHRQAQTWDQDRCIDATMRCVALWESLDQAANARLIATLLRETWLSLLSGEWRASVE